MMSSRYPRGQTDRQTYTHRVTDVLITILRNRSLGQSNENN